MTMTVPRNHLQRVHTIISEAQGTLEERQSVLAQLFANIQHNLLSNRLANGWSDAVEQIITQVMIESAAQFIADCQEAITPPAFPITETPEFGSGEEKGYTSMWETARSKSNYELTLIWSSLNDYDSREYYDREHGIGMDDWAYCIHSIMDERGLSHVDTDTQEEG